MANKEQHLLPRWLIAGVTGLLILFVCWGVSIEYWRNSDVEPTWWALLLHLLIIPVCLLLTSWGLAQHFRKHRQSEAKSNSSPLQERVPQQQANPLALLACSVRLPQATSVEEFASALLANRASTDLDQELVDNDGFPVMSARCDDAVDEMLQEEVREWLAENGLSDLQFDDAQWRTLTLGSAVMRDLASQSATQLISAEGTHPPIELVAFLPAEWEFAHREAATKWFQFILLQFGWPAGNIVVHDQEALIGAHVAQALQGLANAAHHKKGATIVLACASNIAQELVDQWASSNLLFTSSHPQGQMPGEGAAAFVMLNGSQAERTRPALTVDLYLEQEMVAISAGQARKQIPKVLAALADHVPISELATAQKVAFLVSDTGQQTPQVLELMDFAMSKLPHLDASTDVLRTGAACATAGAVPFVAALALAQHLALKHEQPVVCVSNDSPDRRALALITPSHTVDPRATLPKETADA